MSIDLRMEMAKQEYVEAINNINEKYELPLSIVEILLTGISTEVHNMKIMSIQKEQQELLEKEKEAENNEENWV